jgi:2,3,4,5-tetrahydropyridine-2-carboxylate N-succinyltransferase
MTPAVIGDGVTIGANCVIGNGVVIGSNALIFPGTILSQQTRVYDPAKKHRYTAAKNQPLVIPPSAIVIPGQRLMAKGQTVDVLMGVQVAVIAGYTTDKDSPTFVLDRLLDD